MKEDSFYRQLNVKTKIKINKNVKLINREDLLTKVMVTYDSCLSYAIDS